MTEETKRKALRKLKRLTRIDESTGCYMWQGHMEGGYGRFQCDESKYLTHVWSAIIHLGLDNPSDPYISVCHKLECPNKRCWNPEHLYIGNAKTNARDMVAAGHSQQANATHCKKGHPFNSTYKDRDRDKPRRYCTICRMNRVNAWRERARLSRTEG